MVSRLLCVHCWTVLKLWFFALVCVSHAAYHNVDYTCDTNGTLFVINPNRTLFRSGGASNSLGPCTTATADDRLSFNVSGCTKSRPVFFTFSTREEYSASSSLIAGAYTETHRLLCREIREEGIMFQYGLMVTVLTETPEPFNPSTNDPVTPSFYVATAIWNQPDTIEITAAYVAEHVRWKINAPAEYDLLPTSCTVYAGLTVGGDVSKAVVTDGCSLDSDLLSHFSPTSRTTRTEHFAWLYVFRFISSPDITLACTVRVCTRGSSYCSLGSACAGGRRKRRLAENRQSNEIFSVEFVVTRLHVELSSSPRTTDVSMVTLLVPLLTAIVWMQMLSLY